MLTFRHDDAAGEYVALLDDTPVGQLTYRLEGRIMHVEHTLSDPSVRGRGLAGKLTRHVLDDARRRGLSVVPVCPYVAQFIDEHPEYSDVVV